MEVIGTLKMKTETQKVSDRFQKREFILTTEANTPYPQQLSFQLTQDKVNLLDQFSEGEEIKVQFNLRGREWNGPQGVKYFNTLEAWRLDRVQGSDTRTTSESQSGFQNSGNPVSSPSAPAFTSNPDDNDDLPF